jgi:hypothetical protein
MCEDSGSIPMVRGVKRFSVTFSSSSPILILSLIACALRYFCNQLIDHNHGIEALVIIDSRRYSK